MNPTTNRCTTGCDCDTCTDDHTQWAALLRQPHPSELRAAVDLQRRSSDRHHQPTNTDRTVDLAGFNQAMATLTALARWGRADQQDRRP